MNNRFMIHLAGEVERPRFLSAKALLAIRIVRGINHCFRVADVDYQDGKTTISVDSGGFDLGGTYFEAGWVDQGVFMPLAVIGS